MTRKYRFVATLSVCLLYQAGFGFNHPGLTVNASDIAFAKAKVAAGFEPWKSAFERVKARSRVVDRGSVGWAPRSPIIGRPDKLPLTVDGLLKLCALTPAPLLPPDFRLGRTTLREIP